MLKIAQVSQVNYEKGLVKVRIPDRDNVESNWMAMLAYEYEMPKVNDLVRVDMDDDDYTNGICLTRYFNEKYQPVEHGEDIYYKRLLEDFIVKYNKAEKKLYITVEKEMEITVPEIIITGNITLHGTMTVIGGDVIADGVSLKHHKHIDVQPGPDLSGPPQGGAR